MEICKQRGSEIVTSVKEEEVEARKRIPLPHLQGCLVTISCTLLSKQGVTNVKVDVWERIGVLFFLDTNNLMLLGLILYCVEDALIKNYVSSKIGCIGQFVVVGGDALKC